MPSLGDVVLLGASGFVGRAIQDELTRCGQHVVGLSSSTCDLRTPHGLAHLRQLVGQDTILIMAAAITRDRSDSVEACEANIAMAADVAKLVRDHPIRKCLYVSSDAVYGDHRTNRAMTEETPPDPQTLYAAAKLTGELLIREAAKASATPVVLVRPCRIYGPGDPHLTYGPARFIKTALDAQTIELFGDGEERRDFLYIEDAARLICRLAVNDATGVYNVASGHQVSFAQVAEQIGRLLGGSVRVVSHPRTHPVVHLGLSLAKLRQAVADVPLTPLAEGVRKALEAACEVAHA